MGALRERLAIRQAGCGEENYAQLDTTGISIYYANRVKEPFPNLTGVTEMTKI